MGGSNSVFKDGWVAHLAQRLPEPVRNLSVGASTSLCGIYRMLLEDGPQPGDTVIWEYALNESVHVRRGYDLDSVLRGVEHLLRLCADRGCRFVPLIFMPRVDEAKPERPPYYDALLALLRDYGLEAVDIAPRLRAARGVQTLPDECYQDGMHYQRSDEILGLIADSVAEALPAGAVPARETALRIAGRTVRLLEFDKPARFQNSIMSIPVAEPPLRLPLRGEGALLSVICVARPDVMSGLRASLMRAGEHVANARISTTSVKDMNLLKPISLENIPDTDWRFQDGDTLILRASRNGGLYHVEQGLKRRLTSPDQAPYASIAGVLAEVPLRQSVAARAAAEATAGH